MSMLTTPQIIKRSFPFVFITNNLYLFWLAFRMVGVVGMIFWVAEFLSWLLTALFFFNHYQQKREYMKRGKIEESVDIFIPMVNEPWEMVEETVSSARNINYKNKEIYILDDSGCETYRELAKKYETHYLTRQERVNAKAGNLNNGLRYAKGKFVAVFDADQVPFPDAIVDCMGYFDDEKVALVSTKQSFKVPPTDFNHDYLFYDHMQPGRNREGCAISCGSGVIYRRSVLDEIGGFTEWNLVEDLTTSITMNAKGYKSIYVDKAYSQGTAPEDLPMIYKQRGTWGLDTLRLLFRTNLLFKLGRKGLYYFEMCYGYIVSGVVLPILYFVPIYSLFFNKPLLTLESQWEYIVVKTPAFVSFLVMYFFLCRGFQNAQYWAGLFPVYFKAFLLAFLPGRPVYRVTKKTKDPKRREVKFVLPQLLLMFISAGSLGWHLYVYGTTQLLYTNVVWILITWYWILPIILHGLNLKPNFVLRRVMQRIEKLQTREVIS